MSNSLLQLIKFCKGGRDLFVHTQGEGDHKMYVML